MHNVVQLPGQSAGFLGPKYERFQIEGDPNSSEFRVPALELPADVPAERFGSRQTLWSGLSGWNSDANRAAPLSAYYDRAFTLLEDQRLRESLDLSSEPEKTRECYGRNRLGQSVLLARRLAEAGVRFITVFDGERNCQNVQLGQPR